MTANRLSWLRQLEVILSLSLLFFIGSAKADPIAITYRSFSPSAAIQSSADLFTDTLQRGARAILGSGSDMFFAKLSGMPIPEQFHGDIIAAVAAGERGEGFNAAYVSGSDLSKAWGFLFNSGIPMGPTFEQYTGFLYGQGLPLVQKAMERRGVVAIPIGAAPGQLSGYFPEPLSDVSGAAGIGLAGLCSHHWTLRYLPPAEGVLIQACEDLVAAKTIRARNLRFVQAIPGRGSLVDAMAAGKIQGFEFATPVDDVSQLFGTSDPGAAGAKYVHGPAWHQPFLLTWMVINRQVWDGWSPAQQALAMTVAQGNVLASYAANSVKQGQALQAILDRKIILAKWPAPDLALLRDASRRVMRAHAADPTIATIDRAEYVAMLDALMGYLSSNARYWNVTEVPQ